MCVRICEKRKHTVCGGGRAAATASGDLMLMRSVMGVNREREGNRLGLHWQAHSGYALQCACLFIPPLQCVFVVTFLQPVTAKSHCHPRATHHPLSASPLHDFLFPSLYHFPQAQTGAAHFNQGEILRWFNLCYHINDHFLRRSKLVSRK